MALARVVTFDGVSAAHMEEMRRQMESGEPPEGMPAAELLILHDAEGERATAIVLFDNEADYAQGDAILSAMPTEDTPGTRTSVSKYDVAIHMRP